MKYLHRFSWLKDEEIGSLPLQWNWLAGWYNEPKDGNINGILMKGVSFLVSFCELSISSGMERYA